MSTEENSELHHVKVRKRAWNTKKNQEKMVYEIMFDHHSRDSEHLTNITHFENYCNFINFMN